MESKQRNLTVLMFPWLAHGHVFPYLELAKNLSKKNFHIHFCSTSINLTSIKQNLEKSPSNLSIELVELQLPYTPELPPHYHTTKNVPPHLNDTLFKAFQMSSSSFSNIITSLKPDLLIYDAFQPWAAQEASLLGIPAVHFATSGATPYSFFYHRFTHKDSPFPYEAIYIRDYEQKALQAYVFPKIEGKNDQVFAFGHFRLSNEIILMKTCRAIEGKYVDYLSQLVDKKVVPVGLLVTQEDTTTTEENGSEILDWLSEKKPFSTVFISFGSENYLNKEQMEEIAKGLEVCEVNFIWVVRSPLGESISVEEVLPKGFLENVKDRGTIVNSWAPQAKILAHPSVAGFVSHCGMSSIIESMYFGVPIIALPLKLDQPLNARLVVEAGVGVEVIRDENGRFSREDVANVLNKVVLEKTGEDMRVKSVELSEKMRNEDEDAINETAEQLRKLCMEYENQN